MQGPYKANPQFHNPDIGTDEISPLTMRPRGFQPSDGLYTQVILAVQDSIMFSAQL